MYIEWCRKHQTNLAATLRRLYLRWCLLQTWHFIQHLETQTMAWVSTLRQWQQILSLTSFIELLWACSLFSDCKYTTTVHLMLKLMGCIVGRSLMHSRTLLHSATEDLTPVSVHDPLLERGNASTVEYLAGRWIHCCMDTQYCHWVLWWNQLVILS